MNENAASTQRLPSRDTCYRYHLSAAAAAAYNHNDMTAKF